jgi:Uma2 family endonuclease
MATMTTPASVLSATLSLADVHDHLGGIPLHRIRANPPPGFAEVQDVTAIHDKERRLYELIDGALVEKTMGFYESRLAILIGHFLEDYLGKHDLGIVLGEAGTLQILPDQVRIPDACFIGWDHFPNRELPPEPIPNLWPDLAVEVLSESNTAAEMDRKLRDYFAAGTSVVWFIDPETRTARIFSAPDQFTSITEDEVLDGGDLLPGFSLLLRDLFTRAGQRRQ